MADLPEIAEGIGLIFVGMLLSGYAIWSLLPQRKIGGFYHISGLVKAINSETVTVSYTFRGQPYTAELHETLRAQFASLPPEGTEVNVLLEPEHPEKPYTVTYAASYANRGRGAGLNEKFQNMRIKRRMILALLAGIALILAGIHTAFLQ